MFIEVTEQDYKAGKRYSATECPIALAVARQMGGIAEVRAGSITLHNGSTVVAIETPLFGSLTDRIYDFDTYGTGEAFMFELLADKPNTISYEYNEMVPLLAERELAGV